MTLQYKYIIKRVKIFEQKIIESKPTSKNGKRKNHKGRRVLIFSFIAAVFGRSEIVQNLQELPSRLKTPLNNPFVTSYSKSVMKNVLKKKR